MRERERDGKHYAIYVMLMLMMMMIMPSRDTFIDEVVLLASSYGMDSEIWCAPGDDGAHLDIYIYLSKGV